MKNIVRIASALALVVLAASCSKMSPSKSEVEAGFPKAYTGAIPEISFAATPSGEAKFDVDLNAVCIPVKLTVSGVNEELGKVTICVLSSSKADFSNTKTIELEITQDGSYDYIALVNANEANYLKAAVSTLYGCSYSDAVKVDVSDVPFYGKIAGTWKGKVTSLAYDDEYDSVISIMLDEEDPENVCYVCDIEPYWAKNEGSYAEGVNFIKAEIDNENNQIVLYTGSSMNLGGRSYYASDLEGNVIEYDVLKLSDDGNSLSRENAFYSVKSDGKPEDWYSPAVYKKQ